MRYPGPSKPRLASDELRGRLNRLHQRIVVWLCMLICAGFFLKIVFF